jgi:hypothetical protein
MFGHGVNLNKTIFAEHRSFINIWKGIVPQIYLSHHRSLIMASYMQIYIMQVEIHKPQVGTNNEIGNVVQASRNILI